MNTTKKGYINLKNTTLQQDNIYVSNEVKNLTALTGLNTRKGLENVILSAGQIVNVVSDSYGHLPNENFFKVADQKIREAGFNFLTRSINRENRSFAVDYILQDENYAVTVKNGSDKLKPMLRFTNSYDGSTKTSGHFGFYREICSNGLHVAETLIGFSMKHRGAINEVILPEIKSLVNQFMNNEFFKIQRKFEVLAETPIKDLQGFVKMIADKTKLFKFESSDKNPAPSLNARMIIESVQREAALLHEEPNLWLGYNGFNELLHTKLQKSFEAQKNLDAKIFELIQS